MRTPFPRRAHLAPILVLGLFGALPAPSGATGPTLAFLSATRPLTATQTASGGLPAVGTDPAAATRSNPAGLARAERAAAAAGHQSWQSGLALESLTGSIATSLGGIGVDVSAVHAGSLPAYDAAGATLGSFQPIELAVGAGWGRSVLPGLRVGLGARWLYLHGGESAITGVGFDCGLEVDFLGAVIGGGARNLGADAVGPSGRYPIPTEFTLGASRPIGRLARLEIHSVLREGEVPIVFGGGRFHGPGGISLLGGAAYDSNDPQLGFRPRAGLAIGTRGLELAYAFAPDEETGELHHFSLSVLLPAR